MTFLLRLQNHPNHVLLHILIYLVYTTQYYSLPWPFVWVPAILGNMVHRRGQCYTLSLSLLPFLLVIVASSSSSWPRYTFWRNFNFFKIVYKWPLLMGARTILKQYLLHKNLTRIHWSKEHRPFVLLEMLKFRQKVNLSSSYAFLWNAHTHMHAATFLQCATSMLYSTT